MKYVLLFSLLFVPLLFVQPAAYGQEVDSTAWETNGPVHAFARRGNTVYVGGQFSYMGPSTGTGATVGLAGGEAIFDHYPGIAGGAVETAIPDGKGGWFIGGTFTRVQGVDRLRLAHIRSDNSLDPQWRADADSTVGALLLHGDQLFVGGKFGTLNGTARLRLAALDAATGQVTAWNAAVKGYAGAAVHNQVMVLHEKNGILYIGGNFTGINDELRNHLAAVEIATGRVTPWNPNEGNADHPDYLSVSFVKNMSVAGPTMYVCGEFNYLGRAARKNVAAIDVATGTATSWNPNPAFFTARISDMALANDTVYLGGDFYFPGVTKNHHLIALDATDGRILPWYPIITGRVNYSLVSTITVAGQTVYVGGDFTGAGGKARLNLAAFDIPTAQPTDWSPNMNFKFFGKIRELAVSGNTMYVGGDFRSIGGQRCKNLAAVNAFTGRPTGWRPEADANVFSLLVHNDLLYVGGGFSTINGKPRKHLAALDAVTGEVTAFDAKIVPGQDIPQQFGIKVLQIHHEKLYLGGNFSSVGGQARWHLASVDPLTGAVTAWNPNVSNSVRSYVNSMVAVDGKLYFGGNFYQVGGVWRFSLAAVDLLTGQLTPFNPSRDDYSTVDVYAVVAKDSLLYFGGRFNQVGYQSRTNLAAARIPSGQITAFAPRVTGAVNVMQLLNNELYMAGTLSAVDGESRTLAAAVDATTGKLTAWDPKFEYIYSPGGSSLAFIDNRLYVGGAFHTVMGRPRIGMAIFGKKILSPNYIKGRIYHDVNADCARDGQDKNLESVVVTASPGPYYGISDSLGNYAIAVDTGTYVVSQVIPADRREMIRQVCPAGPATHQVVFKSYNDTLAGKDFGNRVTSCTKPYVHVTSTGRRRCASNNTVVAYCNAGNAAAPGAKVFVKLPRYVVLVRADRPFTVDKDSNYVFDVGILPPNGCGTIQLTDSVICYVPGLINLTQCTKVWITPGNNCAAPSAEWDNSDVTLRARCLSNGRVRLALHNAGTGAMADSATFRIFLDARLALQNTFRLAAGDSLILRVPANGRTVRLEADQRPGHPTKQSTNVTLEACGTNANGGVSLGFVAQLPGDDAEPEVAEECLPITDSFDPNDKLVRPAGTTDQHYTPTGTALSYTVRFQNTGNDYAYKVVVVDTLAAGLDISTLQVGAVSHPYRFTVSGKGRPVLTWTFDNINLPDSTRDQAGSNGFIQFSIRPAADLPAKTLIENFADIFFDYNPPVRTNTTANRIYDVPSAVEPSARLDENTVVVTPVITSFTPASGTAGTVVTLTGKHFNAVPGNNVVTFNGIAASVTGATATTLTVTVPPGEAAGRIRVGTPDGAALSATDFLLATPPPTAVAPGLPGAGVRIYPNPAPGRFVVAFSQPIPGITEMVILDARGVPVRVLPLAGKRADRAEVDLTGHPGGMYLVLIRTEHGTLARKVTLRP